jgi:hypothetical protein
MSIADHVELVRFHAAFLSAEPEFCQGGVLEWLINWKAIFMVLNANT